MIESSKQRVASTSLAIFFLLVLFGRINSVPASASGLDGGGGGDNGGGGGGDSPPNTAPTVSAIPPVPATNGSGLVTVYTTVSDSQNDMVHLLVDYSLDGGLTWSPVLIGTVSGIGTFSTAMGTISGIGSTSSGNNLTFTWDTKGNGVTSTTNARIRITPNDGTIDGSIMTSNSFSVDNVSPTVVLSSTAASPTNAALIPMTATFSEAVTGFALGDVTIVHGLASNLTPISSAVYAFNVTPTGDGTVTVEISANAVQDGAGNGSAASNHFSLSYDGTAPSVTIVSNEVTNGGSTTVGSLAFHATFSESVSGFAADDITIVNATLSGFTAVSDMVYDFTILPATNSAVSINVAANRAADTAGNGNTAAAQYTFTTAPALVTPTPPPGPAPSPGGAALPSVRVTPSNPHRAKLPSVTDKTPAVTKFPPVVPATTVNNGPTPPTPLTAITGKPALFDVISAPVQSTKPWVTPFVVWSIIVEIVSGLFVLFVVRKIRAYAVARSKKTEVATTA